MNIPATGMNSDIHAAPNTRAHLVSVLARRAVRERSGNRRREAADNKIAARDVTPANWCFLERAARGELFIAELRSKNVGWLSHLCIAFSAERRNFGATLISELRRSSGFGSRRITPAFSRRSSTTVCRPSLA